MIDFVLERAREQAGRFDLDRFAIESFRAFATIASARSMSALISGKLRQPSVPDIDFFAEREFRIQQDQRHRGFRIDVFAVQSSTCSAGLRLPRHRAPSAATLRRLVARLARRHSRRASSRACPTRARGSCSSTSATRFPLARRIGSPYFTIGKFISLAVRERRQIFHAREFHRVHHFDNRCRTTPSCPLATRVSTFSPRLILSLRPRVHPPRPVLPSSCTSSFASTLTIA